MKRRFGLQIGLGLACAAGLLVGQARAPQQPQADNLPQPGLGSNNFSQIIPKPANVDLRVPPGFVVSLYAEDLPGVRFMKFAPNGDLFVSQFFLSRITVLRDTNGDGKPDVRSVFAENANAVRRGNPPQGGPPPGAPPGPPPNGGFPLPQGPLNPGNPAAAAVPCAPPPAETKPAPGTPPAPAGIQGPMGIAFRRGAVYIANTNSIVRYRYTPGDLEAQREAQKVIDLPPRGPTGELHPWRNIIFSPMGNKMYVAVGSISNNRAGEDCRRAAILEFNPDGSGSRIFASGLRNPEGMAFEPGSNKLWVAVNERDYLGDDLVPDFITSLKDGGFYGWPYSYIGQHYDPRYSGGQPELVKKAIVPDVLIPAHSTPIGLTFYTGDQFPPRYRNGAFIAMHGSWNRATATGYKVGFVRFRDGVPGRLEDFMTGFVVSQGGRNPDGSLIPITQWGRPTSVIMAPDGSLLVGDDQGGRIWQIKFRGPGPGGPPNPAQPPR